jgi:hypothetical protein
MPGTSCSDLLHRHRQAMTRGSGPRNSLGRPSRRLIRRRPMSLPAGRDHLPLSSLPDNWVSSDRRGETSWSPAAPGTLPSARSRFFCLGRMRAHGRILRVITWLPLVRPLSGRLSIGAQQPSIHCPHRSPGSLRLTLGRRDLLQRQPRQLGPAAPCRGEPEPSRRRLAACRSGATSMFHVKHRRMRARTSTQRDLIWTESSHETRTQLRELGCHRPRGRCLSTASRAIDVRQHMPGAARRARRPPQCHGRLRLVDDFSDRRKRARHPRRNAPPRRRPRRWRSPPDRHPIVQPEQSGRGPMATT